jgi:hypothetical protein
MKERNLGKLIIQKRQIHINYEIDKNELNIVGFLRSTLSVDKERKNS